MMIANKRVAVLSPVAWRTPPERYGAWETVASNVAEGLVARGWDVTLFATGNSVTRANLHAVVHQGYEEDTCVDPKVAEYLHISEVFEHARMMSWRCCKAHFGKTRIVRRSGGSRSGTGCKDV